jgi:hypothetical protein
MSSPLAIGAVSAVLRNLLDNGMIEAGAAMGSPIHVSAVAPDTIDLNNPDDPPRLNLFLHQVTPNAGWNNVGQPSRSANGDRLTNAPLAIDLHYVLTAYGRLDFQAEILLGYAMHLLHERPVLDRAAIRRALNQPNVIDVTILPAAFQALTASDLADQVEQIKITQAVMSVDEMSKLWAAIQSHYRPSSAYHISVVLIEGTKPARSPLPVLSRGLVDPVSKRDRGVVVNADLLPPLPTLFTVEPPLKQSGARLGETVTISGVRLAGSGHRVRLGHRLLSSPIEITPPAPNAAGTELTVTLPNDGAAQSAYVAGQLALSVHFTPTGEANARDTNAIPFVLAPAPVMLATGAPLLLPAPIVARVVAPPGVTVTIASRPQVRLEQRATLLLDTVEASPMPRTTAADPLVFQFPDSVPAGSHWIRLRVDGTESVLLDRSGPAPVYDVSQQITVP